MEADIPLGWKPLNLKRYDRTTDQDEHLDAFVTHANLYTNDDAILCRVFLMFLVTPSTPHIYVLIIKGIRNQN